LNFGFPVYILTILFDVSNTGYYVEVENGALLPDVVQSIMRSWKMFLGGHGKSWKIFPEKVCEPCRKILQLCAEDCDF